MGGIETFQRVLRNIWRMLRWWLWVGIAIVPLILLLMLSLQTRRRLDFSVRTLDLKVMPGIGGIRSWRIKRNLTGRRLPLSLLFAMAVRWLKQQVYLRFRMRLSLYVKRGLNILRIMIIKLRSSHVECQKRWTLCWAFLSSREWEMRVAPSEFPLTWKIPLILHFQEHLRS